MEKKFEGLISKRQLLRLLKKTKQLQAMKFEPKKTERNNVGLSNTFASIDGVLNNVLNNIQYDIK